MTIRMAMTRRMIFSHFSNCRRSAIARRLRSLKRVALSLRW